MVFNFNNLFFLLKISNKKFKLGLLGGSAMEAYFRNTRDPILKQLFENNIRKNLQPSFDKGVEAVKTG